LAILAAALLISLSGFTRPASGQTTSASITGVVKDAQGGVIPGATIVLTSETQGTKSAPSVTDANGNFTFTNIAADTYTVEITMSGFKTLNRSGVSVSQGDRVALSQLTLEIGGMSEVVDVRDEAPLIQSQSGDRSFTVTTSSVENLPILARNYTALAELAPGVSHTPDRGDLVRIGGGGQSNYIMDGVSVVDTGCSCVGFQLNPDAIAEVKVLTQGYQAEYGRSSGLQVTAVTKSGSNRFRGSTYLIRRDSDWNSNSWAAAKNGDPKPVSKQTDWGYTIGGPIGRPGGNNKLFFFYAQEYRPRTSGGNVNRFRVPTQLERAGDFSETLDNQGRLFNTIRDASTGQLFQDGGVTGRIPSDRLYQVGLNILNMWPLPNLTQQPGTSYNYEVTTPVTHQLQYQPTVRVDYQWSPRLRFTGKFSGQNSNSGERPTPGSMPGFNDTTATSFRLWAGIFTVSTSVNFTITPTTFLEATYGFMENDGNPLTFSPISNKFTAGLGDLPMIYPDAGVVDQRYITYEQLVRKAPPFFVDGAMALVPTFSWGNRIGSAPPSVPFGCCKTNQTQDVAISLTHVRGPHTYKAGFYYNYSYKGQNYGTAAGLAASSGGVPFQGGIDFGNDSNNPIDSGFGFANAALGIFSSYTQQSSFVEGAYVYNQIEAYAQDDWKVNPKLTLNYGLRVTHQQPNYDKFMQMSNFFPEIYDRGAAPLLYVPGCATGNPCTGGARQAMNPTTGELLGPGSATLIGQRVPGTGDLLNGLAQQGQAPNNKYNYTWPTLAFAPRFGAAYDLSGAQTLVVRGSVGLFYDRPDANGTFSQVGNPPTATSTTLRYGQLQTMDPNGGTSGPPFIAVYRFQNDNLPTSLQWNGGVQFALPWASSLDVSYVGQKATHQLNGEVGRGFVNINAIDFGAAFLPVNQDPTLPANSVPGANAYPSNLLRPFYGYNNIDEQWQSFYRTAHTLQTSFNRRFSGGIQAGINYTLTLKDEGTSGIGSGFNGVGSGLRLDHAPDGSFSVRADQAQYDELNKNQGLRRHLVKANFIWDLPDLERRSAVSRVVGAVINDWQLSGAFTGGSSNPYTITYSYQTAGANVNLTGSPDYPAAIRIVGDPGSGCTDNQYAQFNVDAFAGPVPPSLGLESGRNYMQGCADHTTDLAIARNFKLGGQRVAQVRLELFNAFNTVVFNGRVTQLQLVSPTDQTTRNSQFVDGSVDPARLVPRNAGFGAVTSAQPMRSIQLTLRLSF
jgi:hypothetical protein